MKHEYKRIDDAVDKGKLEKWLAETIEGWEIVNYLELPSAKKTEIRVQILLRKESKKEFL